MSDWPVLVSFTAAPLWKLFPDTEEILTTPLLVPLDGFMEVIVGAGPGELLTVTLQFPFWLALVTVMVFTPEVP